MPGAGACLEWHNAITTIVAPTTAGGVTEVEVGGARSAETTPTGPSVSDDLQLDPEVDALLDSLLKEISH